MPFWVTVTWALPELAPAGTWKSIWYRPTKPGVSPAKSTLDGRASTVTVTAWVTLASVAEGEGAPEATLGSVAPRPTRYITRYSPGLAGSALVTNEPLRCC